MSKVWVCQDKTADIPFSREDKGVRLYSLEELCCYLYQNAEILEEHFFDETLLTWLEEELGQEKLSEELRLGIRQGKGDFWCIEQLLWESGYYSRENVDRLEEIRKKLAQANPAERRKLRADRMQQEGRYKSAVREYYRILTQESMQPELESRIWHNMGTAYAGQFLYQSAAGCYEKAYRLGEREESKKQYLLAQSFAERREQQKTGGLTEGASEEDRITEREELRQIKEDKGVVCYEAKLCKELEQLAKEYMRNE